MIRTLSQADINQLTVMRTAAQARPTGEKRYWEIYQALADKLVAQYEYDSTHPTVLWLRGATQANKGVGAFSQLIRKYTDTQYQLRYSEELSDILMQQASDQVAENLLKNLLGDAETPNPPTKGIVPEIGDIAASDATGVGKVLFDQDKNDSAAELKANSAWSGALLFENLTSDQTSRLISTGNSTTVDTLSDIRDVLFAHQAYSAGVKAIPLPTTVYIAQYLNGMSEVSEFEQALPNGFCARVSITFPPQMPAKSCHNLRHGL